jgi:hypothetical protein
LYISAAMAICEICNQEMLTADGCLEDQNRMPYGLETVWAEYNIRHLPAKSKHMRLAQTSTL